MLTGVAWALADPELVESALQRTFACRAATWGTASWTRRAFDLGGDLGVDDPRDLGAALDAWYRVATREWGTSWLAVESLQPLRLRLDAVRRRLAARASALARGHVDARHGAGRRGSCRAARDAGPRRLGRPGGARLWRRSSTRAGCGTPRSRTPRAGRVASILRWFGLQFPGVGGVTIERATALEEAAAARVVARLRLEVSEPTIGRCRSCGRTCAVVPLCDRCFGRARM